MDKDCISAKEILESYPTITVNRVVGDDLVLFSALNKDFLLIPPENEERSSFASICLVNDDELDFPHIMLTNIDFSNIEEFTSTTVRQICLYENESFVNSIVSYEAKIRDAVDRLIELLSMGSTEKEREFQKEFMFYWNSKSRENKQVHLYLQQEASFSKMDIYSDGKVFRLIEEGMKLSDLDYRNKKNKRKWSRHFENEVYYIPLIDAREILPPHKGFEWSAQEIENILYPKQIEHISESTYQAIKSIIPKTQNIILVFGMVVNSLTITFAVHVKCNNRKGHSLLEKILGDIITIESLYTERKDYLYLNELIGNDLGLQNKKVLIIGAGSLGSYVASELVKNGASNLTIYDGDNIEDANILRSMYASKRGNKAEIVGQYLNWIHPEINIEIHRNNIGGKELSEEAIKADFIIFTVGSSDEQLKLNRLLKEIRCKATVIYVWLEAGGQNSHILVIDYNKRGCYECLFTNSNGELVNNRAFRSLEPEDQSMVRNGCGGTRASYGTAVILRTVAALLNTIKKIQRQEIDTNMLIDITEDTVKKSDLIFPMEACGCCGNKNE